MFGFMKRGSEERERKKREKEEKEHHRAARAMTPEELRLLGDAEKRANQTKPIKDDRRADPGSGRASSSPVKVKSSKSSSSSHGSGQPPIHPKPPKKGILKEKSSYGMPVPNQGVRGNVDDTVTVEENTVANEVLSGAVDGQSGTPVTDATSAVASNAEVVAVNNEVTDASVTKVPPQRRSKTSANVKRTSSKSLPAPRPAVEAVVRPPSPVDKSYDDVNLQLPDVAPPSCPQPRELVLRRQAAGDFGFTLRKGIVLERLGSGDDKDERQRTVIFAEPGPKHPVNGGLLPGDRLIEVNGVNVADATRETVIELIRKSGDAVKLKVQPIPELCELSMRSSGQDMASDSSAANAPAVSSTTQVHRSGTLQRSSSMKYRSRQAKTEEQLASDKAWMVAERVWLVHRGGFAAARVLHAGMPGAEGVENLPEGKCRVKLDHGGELLDVDEEDVEKANPPQFDRIEDLAQLRYLNESCILHTLRQRYAGNLVHSYAGQSLVVINPMHALSIYSDKVIQMFRGCRPEDMPPHIYAVAQTAYRNMLSTRRDQSVVLMGRSGSGKTTSARHVMQYYLVSAGCVSGTLTAEKLNAIHLLLDTFGGSRTISNTSTTNYTQISMFHFDHSGQIVSATFQASMLEKSRLVRRPDGEPSFHVFYQMLAGIDSTLRKELHLENLGDPNPFMTPLQRIEDRQRATQTWVKICNAMNVLRISSEESKAICCVLAAIYHIGVAAAVKGVNDKYHFARPKSAQHAADVLGTTPEELSRVIFSPGQSTQSLSPAYRSTPDKEAGATEALSGAEAIEGFIVGLYSEVFQAVVSLINRALSSNYRVMASVMIVDAPGFRNPAHCGRSSGATFEDLCHNYVQERLQLLFHDTVFTSKQDHYAQENIECDFEAVTSSPAPLVLIIDTPPPTALRSPGQDSREAEAPGILWLLDEEALAAAGTDESFVDLIYQTHGADDQTGKRGALLKRGTVPHMFVISHFQGTNPVQYNVSGWLKACRENPVSRSSATVLQESKWDFISGLFVLASRNAAVTSNVSGSVVGPEAGSSLRRVSSTRRVFTSGMAGIKRRSICVQVKFQVDALVELLRRTTIHFVHCVLPQHNAGLCDLKMSMTPSVGDGKTSSHDDVMLNVPLVRAQIRGAQLVDAVRLHRQGFPENLSFAEFRHRYEILVSANSRPSGPVVDEKQAVVPLLEGLEVDSSTYRLGLSQVFVRAGGLCRLEELREEKLAVWVIKLQAVSRGCLGRKYCEKLKLQHLAAACIQRNVRKLMGIREWEWWRLYTKVKPLLNVQRTEEELRDKEAELEQLRQKLEKSEKERQEFKLAVDRLETKLSELAADYQDEHSTSAHTAELLEAETAERIRLDKEVKDLQSKLSQLQQLQQKTEMQLLDAQMFSASLESELDDEDAADADSALRERLERTRREAEYSKKKLQQQHEEVVEEHEAAKKLLERKLAKAVADNEDSSRQMANLRRKLQRGNQDMADLRLHLEEQVGRNAELEKKQRKFDVELAKVSDTVKTEKQLREKLQRERDEVVAEKYAADQELKCQKMDLEMHLDKIKKLEQELAELTTSEKDDKEVMKMRQAKNELERKVQDQEEELDEQAGTIQQLEQARLRLEMGQERLRQQHTKELEEKELDMESIKASTQKKLRTLEMQMEEEHDERQKLVREKRDLERQMQALSEQKPAQDRDIEHVLRRDLRRTKALLQDAQLMLQKNRDGAGSRTTVKQLRNQLEDAEMATAAAIKARKGMEMELQDLQTQFEALSKSKQETDEKCSVLGREKNELQSRIEENDEEVDELMKKFKAAIQQHSVDLITFQDQSKQIETLQRDKELLTEDVASLQSRIDYLQTSTVDSEVVTRLEAKVRDLEAKFDLEQTSRSRAEMQLSRLKEQVDEEADERLSVKAEESRSQEQSRRLQRQVRELEEELADVRRKDSESSQRKQDAEKKLEAVEAELQQTQSDLQLAFKRIADLQATLEDEILRDSDEEFSDDSEYVGADESNSEGGEDDDDVAASGV